jgi:hypothetical protein
MNHEHVVSTFRLQCLNWGFDLRIHEFVVVCMYASA